jgi:hypothetical protein
MMAISKEKTTIVVVVTKDVKKRIEEIAEEENRSISQMTAILINRGLDSMKK